MNHTIMDMYQKKIPVVINACNIGRGTFATVCMNGNYKVFGTRILLYLNQTTHPLYQFPFHIQQLSHDN